MLGREPWAQPHLPLHCPLLRGNHVNRQELACVEASRPHFPSARQGAGLRAQGPDSSHPAGRPDPTPRQPPGGALRSTTPSAASLAQREANHMQMSAFLSNVQATPPWRACSCSPSARVHGNSPDLRQLRLPAPGRPRSHLSHKQTARNSILMRSLVGAHFRHNCERDTKL